MKKGLIIEGGALRVIFSSGVWDVLLENGIDFDGIMTVSAGACFGCNFKSKQIGRTVRYNKKYVVGDEYCSIKSFLKTGNLFNKEFAYHTIPEKLDIFDVETFEKNPLEFHIVATNIETGLPEYKSFTKYDDNYLEYIRASAAMPIVQQIVEYEGKKYLDGGLSDSIPIKYFESIGYDKNLVILTQPREFVKEKNPILPLIRLRYWKYPNLIQTVKNRHIMYNEQTKYVFDKADKCELLVLCPPEPLGISRSERNPDELQRIYDIGRKVCLENLDRIKEYFSIQ